MNSINKKNENGVTLASLVLYVIVFSIILGLLVNLTSITYRNMNNIDSKSYSSEEFNKFNLNFIKDIKNCYDVRIENNSGNVKIVLSNGVNYNYILSERAIYRDKIKIADKIVKFEAERIILNGKIVAKITIATGRTQDYSMDTDFGKTIKYVLKYW